MTDFYPPKVRAALRRQLTGFGQVPDEYVDEIVDLAMHAVESARQTLVDTLERASDPRVTITAMGPAFSLLAHMAVEQLEHMRTVAETQGKTVHRTWLRA